MSSRAAPHGTDVHVADARNGCRILSPNRYQYCDVRGQYQSGTLYDLAGSCRFSATLLRRLRAGLPAEPEHVEEPDRPLNVASRGPVFLIPLIGYGALNIQPLDGAGDSFRAL